VCPDPLTLCGILVYYKGKEQHHHFRRSTMSKFSKYTYSQLQYASRDIKETLEIWRDSGQTEYVREKELELDMLRAELQKRQDVEIKSQRDNLIKKGIDGLIASMMAMWMVREGLSLEAALSRADFVYWGD
jgi:hypothetical protein